MLLTILAFLIILSVLVITHEAGHFIAARYFGVQVQEFGLGFPPRAATIANSKDGVRWSLNWLPLGGFVKLKGENGEFRGDNDSFASKHPMQKIIILSAGVIVNLALAFTLFVIGYSIGWPQDLTNANVPAKYIKEQYVVVMYVEPDSPADRAQIQPGDMILSANEQEFTDLLSLQTFISAKKNQEIVLRILRAKEKIVKTVVPSDVNFHIPKEGKIEADEEILQKVGIGVALNTFGVVKRPPHIALALSAKNIVVYSGKIFDGLYHLIRDLVISRKLNPNIGGPVMIAVVSGRAAELGLIYIIQFIAILSLNLAIINILPIPALDGGRILFVIIEKFKGRAISLNIENWVHIIGFWFLMFLTLLVTVRDINRFKVWDKIKDIIAS